MGLYQVLGKCIAWYRQIFSDAIQKLQLLRDFSLTPSVLCEAFCYCTFLGYFYKHAVLYPRKHLQSTPSQGGAGDETGICSFLLQEPRCRVCSQLPYKILEKNRPNTQSIFYFILQYVCALYPNPNNRSVAFELYIMFLKKRKQSGVKVEQLEALKCCSELEGRSKRRIKIVNPLRQIYKITHRQFFMKSVR